MKLAGPFFLAAFAYFSFQQILNINKELTGHFSVLHQCKIVPAICKVPFGYCLYLCYSLCLCLKKQK